MQKVRRYIPFRVLLWTACVAAACALLLPSCKEAIPTEIEPEPEPGPVEDLRVWSAPERIEAAPVEMLSSNPVTSLSTSNERDIHLLLTDVGDTLEVHELFRMAYLHYDGATWTRKTEIDGFGIFKPTTSVTTPDGRLHFFWAGIAPEHRESPPHAPGHRPLLLPVERHGLLRARLLLLPILPRGLQLQRGRRRPPRRHPPRL